MPTTTPDKIKNRFAKPASDDQIGQVKKALEANGFKVKVVDDLEELHTAVVAQIPKGSEVFTATSMTIDQAGLTDLLNSEDYISVRNKFMALYGQPDKELEMKRIGAASDYAIGSVHALTEDGYAVMASASGSQIPNYAYGAKNFIWAVGSQKLVRDLDEAIERIENYTFYLEDVRAKEAYGSGSSINKILIYRKEPLGRGTVFIIREPVGF
jgi:hypothetical protein